MNKVIFLTIVYLTFVVLVMFFKPGVILADCLPFCTTTTSCSAGCDTCDRCLGKNIGTEYGSPFGISFGYGNLVSVILSNAIVIAGIIILLMFIFAGYSMIIGAGNGDAQAAARGKQALTTAVIGFVIIFGAYWIILIVQRITGLIILDPGSVYSGF